MFWSALFLNLRTEFYRFLCLLYNRVGGFSSRNPGKAVKLVYKVLYILPTNAQNHCSFLYIRYKFNNLSEGAAALQRSLSMKFAGIIAEYDPFHNGHAWQLAQAKALGAQHVAVAMSCGLTQRGALPLLPEAVRVQAALQCGADLIFALPAPCACAGAEALPGRGAHPCRRRVRCAGVRGRDAGRSPADGSCPGTEQRGLPHRAEAPACSRCPQLYGGAASGGGNALPWHGTGRAVG